MPTSSSSSEHEEHHRNTGNPPSGKNAVTSQPAGPLAPLQKALNQGHASGGKKKVKKSPKREAEKSLAPSMAGPSMESSMMGPGMVEMMGKMMAQPGKTQGAASNPMSSELPGFPGASHIYHIGATGFFLDHSDQVSFNPEQQKALNQIKEKSLLSQATLDRKIDQAEQDLWYLTASDKPDISTIDAKVKELEALKGEKRISFIRSVGEAAKILTPDQRSLLLGQTSQQQRIPKQSQGAGGT